MPGDWDFTKAMATAVQRIADANGVEPAKVAEVFDGPVVARARSYAEMVALLGMKYQVALTFGTPLEELDRVRGGARLALESIKQLHGIVGLKAGEELSVDLSDRMQAFLTRWQERRALGPEPLALGGEGRVMGEVLEADEQ